MQIIFYIMMVAILLIIGTMLQRLFNGPTIFDRMNALGVIGALGLRAKIHANELAVSGGVQVGVACDAL